MDELAKRYSDFLLRNRDASSPSSASVPSVPSVPSVYTFVGRSIRSAVGACSLIRPNVTSPKRRPPCLGSMAVRLTTRMSNESDRVTFIYGRYTIRPWIPSGPVPCRLTQRASSPPLPLKRV